MLSALLTLCVERSLIDFSDNAQLLIFSMLLIWLSCWTHSGSCWWSEIPWSLYDVTIIFHYCLIVSIFQLEKIYMILTWLTAIWDHGYWFWILKHTHIYITYRTNCVHIFVFSFFFFFFYQIFDEFMWLVYSYFSVMLHWHRGNHPIYCYFLPTNLYDISSGDG